MRATLLYKSTISFYFIENIKDMQNEQKNWGQIAIINVYDCPKEMLTDRALLKKFAGDVCRQIDMKPYGEPMIHRFGTGDLEGYSMIQFIETSSITVHLDEFGNRAFVDIFSCKAFDAKVAAQFTQTYFKGQTYTFQSLDRA
jgi:S-adenosylmethionine/arginine decarboxylase-like enzyme